MANYAGAKVEAVLPNVFRSTGEGPHWDEVTGSLLLVDIMTEVCNASSVLRWHAETGRLEKLEFEGVTVTFVVPRQSGGYVIGMNRKIVHLDWDSRQVTTLAEIENKGSNSRLNDAKCDRAGRLWAGTMGHECQVAVNELGNGVLGCLGTDKAWRQQLQGIDLSNGLDWTEDRRTMYFIDSITRKVYAFDFDDASGTIANQRVSVDVGKFGPVADYGLPDGCCLDTNGNLWVACFDARKVVHFNPRTGEKLGEVAIPTPQVTSCCFGGPDYADLYVTSGARGDATFLKAEPEAGSVFKVSGLGVKGYPSRCYLG